MKRALLFFTFCFISNMHAMQDTVMAEQSCKVQAALQNNLYDYATFCIVQEMLQEGQGAFASKKDCTMQGLLIEEIIDKKCMNIEGAIKTVNLKWQHIYTPWGRLTRSGAADKASGQLFLKPLDIQTKPYAPTIQEITQYKGQKLPEAWYEDYEQVKPSENEIEAAWGLLKQRYEKEKGEQEKFAIVRELEKLVYKYSAKKIFYNEQLEELQWIEEGLAKKQMETVCSNIDSESKNAIFQRNVQRENWLQEKRATIAKKLAEVECLASENKKKLYAALNIPKKMSF